MNHSWAAPSRRGLIGAGAGLAAGAAAQLLAGKAEAARGMATLDQLKRAERDPDHRILLRGGIVLSLDPGIGNFEAGDVLIGGKKILAVGRNLNSTASVVDASGMIVMPGFVDTHHHQYETILRGTLADGVLGSPNDRRPAGIFELGLPRRGDGGTRPQVRDHRLRRILPLQFEQVFRAVPGLSARAGRAGRELGFEPRWADRAAFAGVVLVGPGLGRYSPAAKSPYFHVLPPAEPAATYLGIPAGAELIKALMRGILAAISAEAAEPLGWIVQNNFAASSVVRC